MHTVKYLHELFPTNLKSQTTNALLLAVESGKLGLVKYLARYIYVFDEDECKYNAWERALIHGSEEIAMWILRKWPM